MDAFGLGELAQESMPQYVRGDINFLFLREMRIGLGGDTADDAIRFTARKLSAGARHKEGRGVVLPFLRPIMLVERLVEGEETLQVALCGLERRLGLPRDLGDQVRE